MGMFDRNKIEQFLQWEGGQRLFNFAYSVGAAIVIMGALFKILHLPGGNTLLMVGMGTEVLMFLITAFDRPPQEYHWEDVYPQLRKRDANGRPVDDESLSVSADPADAAAFGDGSGATVSGGGVVGGGGGVVIGGGGFAAGSGDGSGTGGPVVVGGGGGGTVIIGGGGGGSFGPVGAAEGAADGQSGFSASAGGASLGGGGPVVLGSVRAPGDVLSEEDANTLSQAISRLSTATEQMEGLAEMAEASRDYMAGLAAMNDQIRRLADSTRALDAVSRVLLDSYRTITDNSQQINDSSRGYVDQMQALNHNISGLNHIYEIQLRSVSGQLDAIDRVNRGIQEIRDMYEKSSACSARYQEETEKMAMHMRELNRVYENMLHAMTVNMYHPGMGAPMPQAAPAYNPAPNGNAPTTPEA